ncbi:photosystem II reaction center W protein, chloroplastic [Selaginella moellendorffii]|nr:photosystem II reaction center W protein, chloroplastic [Selaginella moellendorffii]|eukprot:XP_002990868.2 photosystem II reaction center W protein, chloroplastic [Selaginella moellendorffii]
MAASTLAVSTVSAGAFLGQSVAVNRASVKPIVGLPALRGGRIVCSAEKKESAASGIAASIATAAATFAAAHPALALVDERLSTEGTGLGLGVSDGSLAWILVIVPFALWGFFYSFSQTLPSGEDDGGLSL